MTLPCSTPINSPAFQCIFFLSSVLCLIVAFLCLSICPSFLVLPIYFGTLRQRNLKMQLSFYGWASRHEAFWKRYSSQRNLIYLAEISLNTNCLIVGVWEFSPALSGWKGNRVFRTNVFSYHPFSYPLDTRSYHIVYMFVPVHKHTFEIAQI